MSRVAFYTSLATELAELKAASLYKEERIITTPQDTTVNTAGHNGVLNLCANNYLGLANHPSLRHAAKKAIDDYGFGLSSVRFICGTQTAHKEHRKSTERERAAQKTQRAHTESAEREHRERTQKENTREQIDREHTAKAHRRSTQRGSTKEQNTQRDSTEREREHTDEDGADNVRIETTMKEHTERAH